MTTGQFESGVGDREIRQERNFKDQELWVIKNLLYNPAKLRTFPPI